MARSPELRRIVGAAAAVAPDPFDCTDDTCSVGHHPDRCPWLRSTEAGRQARRALANHAEAFVKLVEACERFDEVMKGGYDGATIAGSSRAVRRALSAVHAIKETK